MSNVIRLSSLIDDDPPIEMGPTINRAIHAAVDAADTTTDGAAPDDLRFTDPLIIQIREVWRQRIDMMRTSVALTLRVRAIARRFVGGDKDVADKLYRKMMAMKEPLDNDTLTLRLATMPILHARDVIVTAQSGHEDAVVKLAKGLPTAHLVNEVRGFSWLSLAAIYAEAGDPAAYHSLGGFYKRMGVSVVAGERQRKKTGEEGLAHAYSPRRRSVTWTIGTNLIRSQRDDDKYRAHYIARKEIEITKGFRPKWAHDRASRRMQKLFLRDVYRAAKRSRNLPTDEDIYGPQAD